MSTRIFARLPLLLRPVLRTASTPILPYATPNTPRIRTPQLFPFRSFRSSLRIRSSREPSPPPPHSPTSTANLSLSQRLKHLIKTYGWYALAVYLIVGAVDFGVAFAGISLFGAEHVSRAVATAKSAVIGFIHPAHTPEPGREETDPLHNTAQTGSEGLWAMLVLAYTVHKTLFMPVRIGVTAAFTPKIVGWLTKRGWAGRAGTKRAADEMKERLRSRSRD